MTGSSGIGAVGAKRFTAGIRASVTPDALPASWGAFFSALTAPTKKVEAINGRAIMSGDGHASFLPHAGVDHEARTTRALLFAGLRVGHAVGRRP